MVVFLGAVQACLAGWRGEVRGVGCGVAAWVGRVVVGGWRMAALLGYVQLCYYWLVYCFVLSTTHHWCCERTIYYNEAFFN